MTWHHHHDGDDRIIFCRADGTECIEEYDGPVCEPGDHIEVDGQWVVCRWHLAWGEYVADMGEQLPLLTHLEAVPDA